MREGNYQVKVTILEANDLIPFDEKALDIILFERKDGLVDPYVTVQINDEVKKTKQMKKQLNPIFNQNLFFELDDMKKQ